MKLKRKRDAPRVGLQLEESTACRTGGRSPVNLLDSQAWSRSFSQRGSGTLNEKTDQSADDRRKKKNSSRLDIVLPTNFHFSLARHRDNSIRRSKNILEALPVSCIPSTHRRSSTCRYLKASTRVSSSDSKFN